MSGYVWKSDNRSFFAHACPTSVFGGMGVWRGLCLTGMGGITGDGADHPSMEKAVGKPKCGICMEEIRRIYSGSTEEAGTVTIERQQEEVTEAADTD